MSVAVMFQCPWRRSIRRARALRGWWGRSWGGDLLLEPGLTHRLCDHLADAATVLTGPSHLCVAGAPLAAVAAASARGLRAIGVGASGEHHSPPSRGETETLAPFDPPREQLILQRSTMWHSGHSWESRAARMRRAASATGGNG